MTWCVKGLQYVFFWSDRNDLHQQISKIQHRKLDERSTEDKVPSLQYISICLFIINWEIASSEQPLYFLNQHDQTSATALSCCLVYFLLSTFPQQQQTFSSAIFIDRAGLSRGKAGILPYLDMASASAWSAVSHSKQNKILQTHVKL